MAIVIATALFVLGLGMVLDTELRITWNAENAPVAQRKNAIYRTPRIVVDVDVT